MGRLLACSFALALIASPAVGCLNDSELPAHEREFRSQYARATAPPPGPSAGSPARWPLVAGGFALLGSAAALTLIGRRSRG